MFDGVYSLVTFTQRSILYMLHAYSCMLMVITTCTFACICMYVYIHVICISNLSVQNMHERLLEMGRSLPGVQTPTSKARETYTKEKEGTSVTQSSRELGGSDSPDANGQGGWTTCTPAHLKYGDHWSILHLSCDHEDHQYTVTACTSQCVHVHACTFMCMNAHASPVTIASILYRREDHLPWGLWTEVQSSSSLGSEAGALSS